MDKSQPPSVGAGQPLDAATQTIMESRFGHDFSGVRVHTDARAAQAADALNARAYTVGRDIVFNRGRFAPHTTEGRRLMAHELAHVVQQTAPGRESTSEQVAEREAAQAGTAIQNGRSPVIAHGSPIGAQCEPQSREELQKRLDQVRHDLGTGTGVRSADATARLKAEEAQLAAALEQARAQELQRQLQANKQKQSVGVGVRSPAAVAQLKQEEQDIQRQMGVTSTAVNNSPSFLLPPPTGAPYVNWAGGNNRGLGVEPQIANQYGATQLPKGYPGADFLQGGTRTPLTGTARVKGGDLPLSSESFYAEGGTVIQLKTLKNSAPSYQGPDGIYRELSKGMEKLANMKPDAGKSEQVGNEAFRVEHSGTADRKILHVELEMEPTPEQMAQLEKLETAGESYGQFGPGEKIELVVNWPGKTGGRFSMAPGSGMAALNLALAAAGMYGRGQLRERQLKEEGYAPVGLAAHQNDSFLTRLGAFFRGDQAESFTGDPGPIDIPVWRENVRQKAAAKQPGETLTVTWQYKDPHAVFSSTEDVPVTYEKQPDGSWRARPPAETPEGFHIPSLNTVIDPKESDGAVRTMLSSTPEA